MNNSEWVVVAGDGTYNGRIGASTLDEALAKARELFAPYPSGADNRILSGDEYARLCSEHAVPKNWHDTDMIKICVEARCKAVLAVAVPIN